MKASSKTRRAGRRISAAASKKIEKVTSAPFGAGLYSVSKKDPAGKVVITARGGRTTVPANMANYVIRAAMELTGMAAFAASTAVQAPAAKPSAATPPARPAASRAAPAAAKAPPKPSAHKASAAKASSSKAPSAKGSTSLTSPGAKAPASAAAPQASTAAKKSDAKKGAVAGKSTAKPPAKPTPAKAPAAAGAASQAPRRGPGKPSNAELAGQQIVHPAQSKARIPESIREFKQKYESRKGQVPPASLTRRFFDQEKKWGYDVSIAGEQSGKLVFDHEGVWSLIPTDGRLAERGVKITIHANPISAFVRVTNGWSRAISPQSEVAAA